MNKFLTVGMLILSSMPFSAFAGDGGDYSCLVQEIGDGTPGNAGRILGGKIVNEEMISKMRKQRLDVATVGATRYSMGFERNKIVLMIRTGESEIRVESADIEVSYTEKRTDSSGKSTTVDFSCLPQAQG